ncbi:MAG: putative Ig domain-containing protein [Bacteroidales bacterium]|nr:putative Ig domain-containing protein [Bacteroidales bacterium]
MPQTNYGLTLGGNLVSSNGLIANASPVTISGTMASQNIAGFVTTGTVTMAKASGTATLTSQLNCGPFTLNGNNGTFNTGSFNITASPSTGILTLSANASLILGPGAQIVRLADSHLSPWTAAQILTITGWEGDYIGGSGTAGQIFVGTDATGLTPGQLSQIRFFDGSSYITAGILSNGELVPSPAGPPANLSYPTPNTYTRGVIITPLTPSVTGSGITYTVSPSLPAGLNLDPGTGVISGTPSVAAATSVYTVTATNGYGFTSFPITITVQGLTFYSRTNGNWDTNTTWSFTLGGAVGAGIYPQAGDFVIIQSNNTVTVNVNSACATVDFTTGNSGAASLTISGTNSLTVSGAVHIQQQNTGGSGSTNTIAVGAGSLSCASIAMDATTSGTRFSQITISTGTVTVSGNITSAGSASRIIFSGAGTLYAGGSFMSGTQGTFTASSGTVNFNAAGAQTIAPLLIPSIMLLCPDQALKPPQMQQ